MTFDTATATFIEPEVSSTVGHWDAQSLNLTDGDSVSTWPDRVGQNDASAISAPTYNATGINGNPSLDCDGSNSLDTGHIPDSTTDLCFFAVVRRETTGTSQAMLGVYSTDGSTDRWYHGTSGDNRAMGVGNEYNTGGGTFPSNENIIVNVVASGGTATWYENGKEIHSASYSGVNDISESMYLCARNFGGTAGIEWNGQIGEIVQAGSITEEERLAETERLANKWGINIYDISGTITQDNAKADGEEENEYRITVNKMGSPVEGEEVRRGPYGYPTGANISWNSPTYQNTNSNGQVYYQATMDYSDGGDLYADFEHTRTGNTVNNLTSTFVAPINVIDDFEDQSLSHYSNDTHQYTITSTSQLEGNYALETTSGFGDIANTNLTCSRGNEYKFRYYNPGSSDTIWFLVGVQDTSSPIDNCYFAYIRYDNDELRLMVRQNGSNSEINEMRNVGLSTGTEYRFGIEYDSTMRLNWYDSNDNLLDSVSGSDSTFSGGTVGFYGGSGSGEYIDYITEDSI